MKPEFDMSVWPGLTREEVEQLATDYSLTVERVRALAHERYPDDKHEAEQLYPRRQMDRSVGI